MSNRIIFSIIIPSYNCEDLIRPTLDSIISQESIYECIVIDGGSNDGTIDIVKEYANNYSNISFISKKDKGIYDAMNKGIDLAKGEYLYFIGAGDKLYKNALANVNMNINGEEFIHGKSYHVSKNEFFYYPRKKSDVIYNHLNHQATFYKKTVFIKVGKYDLRYRIFADNVLNKKIFGKDTISKKLIDVNVAYYLGGGVSENANANDGFYDDFVRIAVDAFGEEYLKAIYKPFNISNKRIIAWGNSGEYVKANNYKKFNIDYFVKSEVKQNEFFNTRKVKAREELLLENKNDIFIFVYSKKFYNEIREWLEENNFEEFKDFMLVTEDVLRVLNYINRRSY